MIYVYVFSIVLVAILIILFFVILNKQHEKGIKTYRQEKHNKQTQPQQEDVVQEEASPVEEEIEPVNELEDFVWEKEQVAKQENESDEELVSEDNVDDYEKFLKENNIDVSVLDDDDSNTDDEDLEFDFNELIGKTNEEIAEIIKKYPPEVQEIVMQELANDEDDE